MQTKLELYLSVLKKSKYRLSPQRELIKDILVECLKQYGDQRGIQLQLHTSIQKSTIYDRLCDLIEENKVEYYHKKRDGCRGRPQTFYRLKQEMVKK